jgi:hypothetical protein
LATKEHKKHKDGLAENFTLFAFFGALSRAIRNGALLSIRICFA